jgi:alpha-L-fucosidase
MIYQKPTPLSTDSSAVSEEVISPLNLTECRKLQRGKKPPPQASWFQAARFGMFVHYGLYSSLERGSEWSMFKDRIPKVKYNLLADKFTADQLDMDEWVGLAKRAGAGYAVLVARHHDGFCLWNTATTKFNSVNAPARRDLVREYVTACRRVGLRIGIYYSIMSWQFPAIHSGPYEDPEGWEAMVAETHQQVRELMSQYGQIDLLWYDGCVVPGCGEDGVRSKWWRSRELNAMVRRLQPRILINDRSASAEDISTPEQDLTPPPAGRLWEGCQTIGNYWAWHSEDVYKDSGELIRQLIFCARYGGNYLLNISPRGDGSIPPEQVERMEAIGRWLSLNSEAIRSSERTPYTEAEHILGPVTARGNHLYFHIINWPELPVRIAGIKTPIVSIRLLATGRELKAQQSPDGTVTLLGLPSQPHDPHVTVVAIELAKGEIRLRTPVLLVARNTGHFAPAEAAVQKIAGWDWGTSQRLAIKVPVTGSYTLDLGVIGRRATRFAASIDGREVAGNFRLHSSDYPDTIQIRHQVLTKGRHQLELSSARGVDFGLYLWRLQPKWRCLGGENWRVMGPFPTAFRAQGTDAEVREALGTKFAPEAEAFDGNASYPGIGGDKVRWQSSGTRSQVINFARLSQGKAAGVCYARTLIHSPEKRHAEILLGCDWWAQVLVNRTLVQSNRDAKAVDRDGAWFTGWKPIPARIWLREGENEIMVKCHPGSTNIWFVFYINDPGDLKLNLRKSGPLRPGHVLEISQNGQACEA